MEKYNAFHIICTICLWFLQSKVYEIVSSVPRLAAIFLSRLFVFVSTKNTEIFTRKLYTWRTIINKQNDCMLVIPREDRRAERNYQLPLRKAKAHCKTDEAVPSV